MLTRFGAGAAHVLQNLLFWMEVERYKDMAQGDPRKSEAKTTNGLPRSMRLGANGVVVGGRLGSKSSWLSLDIRKKW